MAKIIVETNNGEITIMAAGTASELMKMLNIAEEKILENIADTLHVTKEQMRYIFDAKRNTSKDMSDSELETFCMETLNEMLLKGKDKKNG